ncbi:MAG TPA: hypothetical protein VK824_08805, partial [Planctomycetota bacterium]|nr:hypothetical protein [Planctomycetota bacterium]
PRSHGESSRAGSFPAAAVAGGAHESVQTVQAGAGAEEERAPVLATPREVRGRSGKRSGLHSETLLDVAHLGDASDRASLAARLREDGGEWISPGPVAFEGAGRALLLRDPSGHAVELHAAASP